MLEVSQKNIDQMLSEIPSSRVGELKIIRGMGKSQGFNAKKYSDARKYLSEFYDLAVKLNLVDAPPLSVLDIGCGAGWLEYVLQWHGHSVYGIDVEHDILDRISQIIGTSRHINPIVANEKMDVKGPYDIIISKGAFFDRGERLDGGGYSWVWAVDDYVFFLEDVYRNLAVNGRFYFSLNGAGWGNTVLTRSLWHTYFSRKTFLLKKPDLGLAIDRLRDSSG